MYSYLKIFTGSPTSVLSIKQKLSESNILPIIKDANESSRLAGFGSIYGQYQDVYVHKDEFEKSKKLIDQITQ